VVTGVCLICGIGVAIAAWRRRSYRVVLLWLGLGFLLIALSSHAPAPTFTRLFYVLPPAVLLAGLGLWSTVRMIHERWRLPEAMRLIPVAVVLATIPWLNLHQILVDSPPKLQQNWPILVVRALQEHPTWRFVHVVGPQEDFIIEQVMSWYPWMNSRYVQVVDSKFNPAEYSYSSRLTTVFMTGGDQGRLAWLSERLAGASWASEVSDPNVGLQLWLLMPGSARSAIDLDESGEGAG